jgi:hypothetical protein
MTSASRRAVAFALAEATRRTGLADQRRTSSAGPPWSRQTPGVPRLSASAKHSGASSWKEGWTSTPARAIAGQQRVAWDPAFEPDPVGDAPATRGPLQAGTVRALAVAPQHGLPVAQVAQRPNRQLPPSRGVAG